MIIGCMFLVELLHVVVAVLSAPPTVSAFSSVSPLVWPVHELTVKDKPVSYKRVLTPSTFRAFKMEMSALPPMYTGPLPSECRAVLFDIDGTLADSFHLAFSATNKVLTNNNFKPINDEQYHYGSRFTTPIRLATHTGLQPGDANFEEIGRKLGAEFDQLYINLVDSKTAGFYSGMKALIQAIPADVQVGALTNAAVAYAEAVLQANGVRELFSAVHGADDVPKPKPAPDGILQCLSEMGVKPSEAVYIGDSPSDGRAALAAGCASVAVSWGANTPESLAGSFDTIVHSVSSLAAGATSYYCHIHVLPYTTHCTIICMYYYMLLYVLLYICAAICTTMYICTQGKCRRLSFPPSPQLSSSSTAVKRVRASLNRALREP